MPEFTVACPHCQQPIRVMSEHAGAQVACPLCANAMVVPQMAGAPTPEQVAQQQAAEEQAARAAAAAQVTPPLSGEVHTFGCSHCSQPFQVTGESLGQAVQCPSWNAPVLQTPIVTEEAAPPPDRPVINTTGRSPITISEPAEPENEDPKDPVVDDVESTVTKELEESEEPKKEKRSINPANAPVPLSMGGGVTNQMLGSEGMMGVLDAARLLPPRYPAMVPRMADIALSADGKAVASMSFQQPVKTILVNGQERVLRRLSPEEKVFRRRQRNAVVFVCGILFLLVAGALMVR